MAGRREGTVAPSTEMRRALRLAARGRYRTSPNPMVGAVLTRGGVVVGEGWHRQVGGPHAEVEALSVAGEAALGATLHVTLEPCVHHGRTPPCVDAVIDAGIRRVVAAHRDPDPRVAGLGFERLRAAGIEVEVGDGAAAAVELNWKYLVSRTAGRPGVTLKWAMSLDGKIATVAGDSRWISSPQARRESLTLREEHDAIVVGSGTALADDPLLTRRLQRAAGPIVRVVLDRRLRLPAGARMLREDGPVLVYTEASHGGRELTAAGATIVRLTVVEPVAVLADLAARGVQSVLVEGGGGIHAAFVEQRAFDRVVVDSAPLLIGGATAPTPVAGGGFERLAAACRLEGLTVRRRGADRLLEGFREGCLPALSSSVGAS